jgi:hypothetical protein
MNEGIALRGESTYKNVCKLLILREEIGTLEGSVPGEQKQREAHHCETEGLRRFSFQIATAAIL